LEDGSGLYRDLALNLLGMLVGVDQAGFDRSAVQPHCIREIWFGRFATSSSVLPRFAVASEARQIRDRACSLR
jgi:hypothetical protein